VARPTRLTVLLAVALASCGAYEDGARAYREGRFQDARAAFAVGGDERPAELLVDEALAALGAEDLGAAENAAANARSDADVAPVADFVLGNVAFARCALAEKQASTIEAEPFAFDAAIAFADTARNRWTAAAASRDDWPAARRNAERAAVKADDLRRRRIDASDKRRRSRTPPSPRPAPAKPTDAKEPAAQADEIPLTREQVLALFEQLAAKEKEKLASRRARRERSGGEVERDW
jgi:hypothetical protein